MGTFPSKLQKLIHTKRLRKQRLSFETKIFTVATLLVGLAVVGVIAYDLYLQPAYEIFHACAAWGYAYTGHQP
jgi:1,4-dihydroxy-2-naphthoate octaprenyltransferase